jgi:uncharacterized protein (DUF58 family)
MPTRHGWMTLALGVAAAITGRIFGLIELFVIGAAAFVAVLVALLASMRRPPLLQLRRIARPPIVPMGEPARVDLSLRNSGRHRTPPLRLWEPVGSRGGAPMQVAAIAAGESVTAAYRIPTTRRGPVVVGPLEADRTDLLGLCRRTWTVAEADEVLVVPRIMVLPMPSAGSAGRLGQHLKTRTWGQRGAEFHALRPYVNGDDPRVINWKASARAADLIVRDSKPEGLVRCTVVLDDSDGDYDSEAWERAVSVAASLVCASANGELTTRLVSSHLDIRGPHVIDLSLHALARAEPRPDTSAPLLHSQPTEGLGLIVLVTTSMASEWVDACRQEVRVDDTLVVVTCAEPPQVQGFCVDGSNLERMASSWSLLCRGRS